MLLEWLESYLGIIISFGVILGMVVGVFKWKWNQAMNAKTKMMLTTLDIKKLTDQITKLCDRMTSLEKKLDASDITHKEDEAIHDVNLKEISDEMHEIKGKVDMLVRSFGRK